MKKTIKIDIPEPCHEDWNAMSPAEKGRYCESCEKVVIDFTQKTDERLVKELSGAKNVCGRFRSTQLNRELKLERKSGLNLAPYAAGLLLPLSLLANNPKESNNEKPFVSLGIGIHSEKDNLRSIVTTTGRITDESGKGIPGVEIIVKETGKSEISGLRGHYQIKSLDHNTLVFSKDGYISIELELTAISEERDITLKDLITCSTPTVPKVDLTEVIYGDVATTEDLVSLLQGKIGRLGIEQATAVQKQDSTVANVIKGVVTDEYGLPLPGANVTVKESKLGTQTDFDGKFSIEVADGQSLRVSYVGFSTKEISIPDTKSPLNIKLEEDPMGEVVVVVGGMVRVDVAEVNPKLGSEIDPKYQLRTESEYREWKNNVNTAHQNERAYRKLKIARKKAIRKLRVACRKRK